MQLPPFGILYIILSLLFCFNRKWFTYWFVLGNSMFYTTIIGFGTHTSIKPYHLNILLMFCFFVRGKLFKRDNFKGLDSYLLLAFFFWILFSFLASFLVPIGYLQVAGSTASLQGKGLEAFIPGLTNVSQLAFPIFGIFAYFVVKPFIRNLADVQVMFKGYIYSFFPLTVVVIGLFTLRNIFHNTLLIQAFFKFINVLYDRDVTNDYNSIGDISRTFTYVGEASFTANYYLMMAGIFITMLLYKTTTKRKIYFLLALLVLQFAMIVVLGSTTGYVGFCILLCLITFLYIKNRHLFNWQSVKRNGNFLFICAFIVTITIIPLFVMFYDQITFFWNYLQATHLDKLEGTSGSGVNRLASIINSLEVFLKSPVFGVGYGNNRSDSYFVFLLSNTGLVGFGLINLFCLHLVVAPLKRLKFMPEKARLTAFTFVTIFLLIWIIDFLFASNVTVLFGWFWAITAMLSKFCDLRTLDMNHGVVPQSNIPATITNVNNRVLVPD